ncbi:protein kinase domain-containing protein [Clostridium tagluense]|uniref:protein kinase domain-containing protein n=1 Tax=Clostridium tagluense TaxID=360422 RepID=UPI001CF3F15C|nr:protein kinase [Clostridium tagluense]MCB2297941.1 protein kinase [Clostridium tagluense]
MKNYKYKDNILEMKINNKWEKITFDGYNISGKIGEGANGIVLKVRHIITERDDAIKIWLPHKFSKTGKVSQQQYMDEIRKVAKIKNNNIVTIYDAKIIYNEIYTCVMEYIEGESLKEWIIHNYGIETRINICKKILETVLEYQTAGIIHGDLHGGNIIIDGEDNIHIIDFGTSLFGRDNQSKERESNFTIDLVKNLLGDYFIETCFEIKNYSIRDTITAKDDSRRYEPLLITKTLIHYIELVNIKLMTNKLTNNSLIIEYCINISQGIYFNINGIINELLSWNSNEIMGVFIQILYDNIYNTIFGEDVNDSEDIFYTTLFIYYEIFRKNKNKIDFVKTETQFYKFHRGSIEQPEYKEYIEKLKNYKSDLYTDYHRNLVSKIMNMDDVYEVDYNNRSILADLIQTYYGQDFILILYKIWQRTNEIWLDKNLHNRILEMSNLN